MRLQKYLASAGLGSRRQCERLITDGLVAVNGAPASLGVSVSPGEDRVECEGRPVVLPEAKVSFVLNKPRGYLSACRRGREEGRLVTELVDVGVRLFPVGRLDRESEGLLILTNDGELALRLTHPRYGKEKEYEVELDRPCRDEELRALRAGVTLEDGPAKPVAVEPAGSRTLRILLAEGRKRQVRRMVEAVGRKVTRLRRVRVAGLRLGSLKPGQWRQLTTGEVADLKRGTDHTA